METLKRAIRILEASLTPRKRTLEMRGHRFQVHRSIWWESDAAGEEFRKEITPYFDALPPRSYRGLVDAGGATGLFAIPMLLKIPALRLVAFEPSQRQRILLERNLRLNRIADRSKVESFALWNREEDLPFRTHGDISCVRGVGAVPLSFAYEERAQGLSLDEWARRNPDFPIDLIKMDVEGAEIEILEGAQQVLNHSRPVCLIQAYHLRDGMRTFESCARFLQKLGYACSEAASQPGLLVVVPA